MKIILFFLFFTITLQGIAQLKPIESGVIHWDSLPVKKDGLRESRNIATLSTNEFEYFKIHATTQLKGALPKPAHTQKDIEELIIIKTGTMKCSIGNKTAVLGAGSVLLIPPGEAQVLENAGDGPLTYYVFQFRSKKIDMERSRTAGGILLLNADSLPTTKTAAKGGKKYFDRPTAMCQNFEMHITSLYAKGPSHAAHTHIDTEICFIIEGNAYMTIDGKEYTASAGDMFIANSGSLHSIGNTGDNPCSYFAFKWR